jgi:tRNA dimethylallyltransferase
MADIQAERAVLIAGPTASGKSAAALALARRLNGVVINADSMQVYRDLRVLTARPSEAEERSVPHLLYGHVDAATNYSVGAYVRDAAAALAQARAARRVPIFVGGTGLYFKALTQGLSAVPEIASAVRDSVRQRLIDHGVEALHHALSQRDPAAAERLSPRDQTRIARALEVVEATGRPLRDWQSEASSPLLAPGSYQAVFLAPHRERLSPATERRFVTMLEQGALAEVEALARRGLSASLPAMKAHGVPALIRHLEGDLPLQQAISAGQADTRRYSKRQFTWFRHQLAAFEWVAPEDAGTLVLARREDALGGFQP